MTDRSNTADDILACARRLIAAGGYNGFSYADIAAVVGIRKPSIHHHFPTKAELVRVLVARYRDEARSGLTQLAAQVSDPLQRLRTYVAYWKACIADASNPFCVCALLASETPLLPAEVALEVRAHFRALAGWLTATLEQGQQTGRLRLRDAPAVEAESFMATVHGAMLSARAYGNAAVFAAVADPLVDRLTA